MSSGNNYTDYARNTFVFTLTTILLKTILGLAFALLLHNGVKHLRSLYRLIIFLPAVLPMVVVGIIFHSVLNPRRGLLNEFLRAVGLNEWTQQWLTDPRIALYVHYRRGYVERGGLYHGDFAGWPPNYPC